MPLDPMPFSLLLINGLHGVCIIDALGMFFLLEERILSELMER